ncbi:MAG: methyltransferase domain-containing protein [Hyphomicrobiaceae bacterium]|nr:methyltransferase domain-containing protein [Hyphomicrobiaceae bacterium]
MRQLEANRCPVCTWPGARPLLEMRGVPICCNVLWPSRAEALQAPVGDIRLRYCADCGHIFNAAFDPGLMSYTEEYENSLHFSARFQSYAHWLAEHLVGTHDIRGRTVIDIGCGKGDFLATICATGDNRGYGFDRSYSGESATHRKDLDLTFVREFYSEQYAAIAADLICCRHVLEHLADPIVLVEQVRTAAGRGRDAIAYFEVPNGLYTLRDLGIWDLIYEHCSYFSPASLEYLFRNNGFLVLEILDLYEGQYIGIACRRATAGAHAGGAHAAAEDAAGHAAAFAARFRRKVKEWQARLDLLRWQGRRTVVWGGGSKGVTFLNLLTSPLIEFMVDINPRKLGKYVAGTGQQVIAPEQLVDYRPDVVIVMNPVYRDEIREKLDTLGLSPELLTA